MIHTRHATTPLSQPRSGHRSDPEPPLASEEKTAHAKPPEPDVSHAIWKGLDALFAMGASKQPKGLNVALQGQGLSNACGTTSLAMLLSYWGIQTNHQAIDAVIRRTNMPTAPDDLVRYAESVGLRASLKTDAGLEDLAAMLDQGVPVQVLIDPIDPSGTLPPNPNDAILHYVNVTGYERGPDGRIARLTICDPGNVGYRYSLSAAEFEKVWSNLKLMGLDTGINRLMIAVAPADDRVIVGLDGKSRKARDLYLPKAEGREGFSSAMPARVTMQGLANITNGLAGIELGSMLGGTIQFLVGGMASLPGAGVRALVKGLFGSDAIADMAGKAVSTVMAPIAAVGEAVGGAVQTVGNAISDGLKAVGNFLKFW